MISTELTVEQMAAVVGGASEPPKYLTPEAEAEAKKWCKAMQGLLKTNKYREAIPDSGLMVLNEDVVKNNRNS